MKVIVAGGGLAGLMCAYELMSAGHEVVVLEGQERVGGRVQTLRTPFSGELHAEAGALFIPDTHALTWKYIRLFGLRTEQAPQSRLAQAYYVRRQRVVVQPGAPARWPLKLTAEEELLSLRRLTARYVHAGVGAQSPDDERLTFAEFLRQRGASADAISLIRLGYFGIWGDGPENCSALGVLRDAALGTSETVSTITGGNDLLPNAFASKLGGRIWHGCRVLRIEQNARHVIAVFQRRGEQDSVQGDRLVCAVPFSTLRHITVDPPFSDMKTRAIRELEYTSVCRVFLQVRDRFWIRNGFSGYGAIDAPVMRIRDCTPNRNGKRGLLECYLTGPDARLMTAMGETERILFALNHVESLYPEVRDHFETGAAKCWDEDEWARGAYAYAKPGQMSELFPYIASCEGRIHFAGDHTSPWLGWMQGAFESAERVIREMTN